jgi:hypothetical protein
MSMNTSEFWDASDWVNLMGNDQSSTSVVVGNGLIAGLSLCGGNSMILMTLMASSIRP